MNTNANDPDPETESSDGSHSEFDRYAAFDTKSGVVIYDKKNASAWIQSDTVVNIAAST